MGLHELRTYVQGHHGVFDRAEASRLGVTYAQIRQRIQSGEFIRLERGVFGIAGVPPTWRRSARIATLTTGGFLSHSSALAAHEVDGFSEGPIHVTIPKTRSISRPGVTIHRSTQFGRAGVSMVDGVAVSSVERAVLDFAGHCGPRRLEWAIDAVLRQEKCDLPDLFDVWVRHSIQGRNGCGSLRRFLEVRHLSDPTPDSRWNRMVGQLLVDSGLPEPQYEFVITNNGGNFIARVDLAFPRQKVVIELDSVRWHLSRESFEKDPRRKNALTLSGWTVLTFTWSDYIDNPRGLVASVASALAIAA